jgi:hypothetical protein
VHHADKINGAGEPTCWSGISWPAGVYVIVKRGGAVAPTTSNMPTGHRP